MHKVVGYKTGDEFDPHGNKMDFCPECGALLRSSQYGTDDKCPVCGKYVWGFVSKMQYCANCGQKIDWGDEDELYNTEQSNFG